MEANQKIAVIVLSIILNLIIIIYPVQSNQIYAVHEKSNLLLPNGRSRFDQEKQKYQYVGIEKCASTCHDKEEMGFQYNIMKNDPHSQAFKILASKRALHYAKHANLKVNLQESKVCLKCHVTGGSLDSSFFAVTYKKEDGVTCEACHKGAYITKTFLPTEIDCLTCHNDSEHKISKFNFKDKSKKIAHPIPKGEQKKI
jgi:hypothetical protein